MVLMVKTKARVPLYIKTSAEIKANGLRRSARIAGLTTLPDYRDILTNCKYTN